MSSRFERYKNHGRHSVCLCRKECEPVVRNGLAYSPADMARLTERGMPVNGLAAQKAFFDGEENPSFFITSDRERHVDVCDLWEQHMQLRDKAREANKARKSQNKSV